MAERTYSFVIEESDAEIISTLSQKFGASLSASLRQIIREWSTLKTEAEARDRYQRRMVMASVNGIAMVDPTWAAGAKPEDNQESPDFGSEPGFSLHTV